MTNTPLRLIGYWRSATEPDWPEVRDFVDSSWDVRKRSRVADHLGRGALLVRYRGLSPCRICGRDNGSAELTDGVYYWPEGLRHYVVEHDVRLPAMFAEHVLTSPRLFESFPAPEFDDLGQRTRGWAIEEADSVASLGLAVNVGCPSGIEAAATRWTWVDSPGLADDPRWVEVDHSWWLQQSDL